MEINNSASYRLVMLQQELVMTLGSSSEPDEILEHFTMRVIKALNLRCVYIIQKEHEAFGLESAIHRVPFLAPDIQAYPHLQKYVDAVVPERSEFLEQVNIGEAYWYCYSIKNLGYMIIQRLTKPFDKHLISALSSPIIRFGQLYTDSTKFSSVGKSHDQIKTISEHLNAEKNKLTHILDAIDDTVLVFDDVGLVYFINPAGKRLLNADKQPIANNHFSEYFSISDSVTLEEITYEVFIACQQEGKWTSDEPVILSTVDGRELIVRLNVQSITDQFTYYVCTINDITDAYKLEQELTWHVNHDPLTYAYNRRGFEDKMNQIIEAERRVKPSVLITMDLDRFKHVNDVGGHLAGDALLQQVTMLMSQEIRKNDVLARVGGDEFCIILQNCTTDQGMIIAEKIRKNIDRFRFAWERSIFTIGISLGVTEIKTTDTDLDTIFLRADQACFSSKENGRNQVTLAENLIKDNQSDDHLNVNYLHCVNTALLNLDSSYQFVLHRQRIIPLFDDNQVEHIEVLLRILHKGKLIPPNAFLPTAERSGQICEIDFWVLEKTLQYLRTNKQSTLNVNISGMTLSVRNSRAVLYKLISNYPREAKYLCLEITETSAITNLSSCIAFMKQLGNLGVCFALDDFGTGVSSFSYLKALPIKYLKIDGSFIQDICDNEIDEIMVQSIVSAAKAMNILTVAEYVSTPATLAKVRGLGVDYAQGNFLSEPTVLLAEAELEVAVG